MVIFWSRTRISDLEREVNDLRGEIARLRTLVSERTQVPIWDKEFITPVHYVPVAKVVELILDKAGMKLHKPDASPKLMDQ